jgi:hypothetical protein
MVVDIINKTLDTVAIVKKTDTNITYRTILPILTIILRKLGTSIFLVEK